MRKYLSVFGLYARSTLIKAILVIIGTCGIQALLLWLRYRKLSGEGACLIEECVMNSGVQIVLLLAFLLLTALLCIPGAAGGTRYTLERLRVSEKTAFALHAVTAMFTYFMLWAAQVCLFYAFAVWFARTASPAAGEQAIFLAFYRNDLMHSLLPLQTAELWVRNVLFVVVMGLVAAETPLLARKKRYSYTVLPAAVLVICFFVRGLTTQRNVILAAVMLAVVLLKILFDFAVGEEDEPYESPDDAVFAAGDAP
jgi:hypothetical protein